MNRISIPGESDTPVERFGPVCMCCICCTTCSFLIHFFQSLSNELCGRVFVPLYKILIRNKTKRRVRRTEHGIRTCNKSNVYDEMFRKKVFIVYHK